MRQIILVFLMTALALPAYANQAALDAMNAYRASKGRGEVTYSKTLEKAAQGHLNEISKRNVLTHTGRNGSDVGKRVKRAGYKYCFAAENIANGFKSFDGVFNAWQNSSGHRKNMLNRKVREMGIARSKNGYWVLVMAGRC